MKTYKKVLLGVFLFLVLILIWGLIEPYTISVEEEQAIIPNLPEEWVGEKIVVMADFQIGMWLDNDSVIPRVIEKTMELEPKVVLVLGDFVYHSANDDVAQMEKVIDYLKPLTENNIKVYAVLGNHDYSLAKKDSTINRELADRVSSKLEEIDVTVLKNESVALSMIDGNVSDETNTSSALYIAGIGSLWADESDVEKTLNSFPEDAPRFVMMHNPETFPSLPPATAPVAVAGHTHGGQIRLPFFPQFSYMNLVSEDEAHVDGWVEESYGSESNNLYVNRGIGLSLLPLRFNCPPELTVFTLQKQ